MFCGHNQSLSYNSSLPTLAICGSVDRPHVLSLYLSGLNYLPSPCAISSVILPPMCNPKADTGLARLSGAEDTGLPFPEP